MNSFGRFFPLSYRLCPALTLGCYSVLPGFTCHELSAMRLSLMSQVFVPPAFLFGIAFFLTYHYYLSSPPSHLTQRLRPGTPTCVLPLGWGYYNLMALGPQGEKNYYWYVEVVIFSLCREPLSYGDPPSHPASRCLVIYYDASQVLGY